MKKRSFEIGMVYKRDHRLYLAVDHDHLITFRSGEVRSLRPNADRKICSNFENLNEKNQAKTRRSRSTFLALRHLPVKELVDSWGITSEVLDKAFREAAGRHPKPSGKAKRSILSVPSMARL